MKVKKTNCEDCIYYTYDEDFDCYTCMTELDEDEMLHFIGGTFSSCPYYRGGDDYTIVRKQN